MSKTSEVAAIPRILPIVASKRPTTPSVGSPAMVTAISVAIGGAIGSLARYGLAGSINFRSHPWGTVVVNVVGSFALGVLVGRWGMSVEGPIQTGLAIGLLGGFTTFSTFAVDTIYLWEQGDTGAAALSVVLTLVLSVGAAVGGVAVGRLSGV